MHVEWRLQRVLDREGISAYRLAKESGISTQNLYPLVRGKVSAVRTDTLVKLIDALARLTGKQYGVGDVLEVIPDQNPHADRAQAQP